MRDLLNDEGIDKTKYLIWKKKYEENQENKINYNAELLFFESLPDYQKEEKLSKVFEDDAFVGIRMHYAIKYLNNAKNPQLTGDQIEKLINERTYMTQYFNENGIEPNGVKSERPVFASVMDMLTAFYNKYFDAIDFNKYKDELFKDNYKNAGKLLLFSLIGDESIIREIAYNKKHLILKAVEESEFLRKFLLPNKEEYETYARSEYGTILNRIFYVSDWQNDKFKDDYEKTINSELDKDNKTVPTDEIFNSKEESYQTGFMNGVISILNSRNEYSQSQKEAIIKEICNQMFGLNSDKKSSTK